MKVFVIGAGRWGSFITWYLDSIGHSVALYGREGSAKMKELIQTRKNGVISLPESVKLTTSLDTVTEYDAILISIDSQGLSALMDSLKEKNIKNKIFILCMKGIEIGTGKRLSEIVLLPYVPRRAYTPRCRCIASYCGRTYLPSSSYV